MANRTAQSGVDYLTLDYEGFRQMMIDKLKEKLPEYTDYSETDMGIILIELLAHGLDILSYYRDRQALECFLPTARQRKNVMMHCKMFGYTLRSASPAVFEQIFTKTTGVAYEYTYSDKKSDPAPLTVRTVGEDGQNPEYFEVIGSLDADNNFSNTFYLGSEAVGDEQEGGKYLHRAVVIGGRTIRQEEVGSSNHRSYQKFTTSQSPVMSYTPSAEFNEMVVRVYVGGTTDEHLWTKVDNFLLSNPDSKHYKFSVNEFGEGIIEFGNDSSGMIPPEGAVIYCSYRVGGGIGTNVGANTITVIDTTSNILLTTTNPSTALVAGVDEETIEEAKTKAIASLRSLDRAVTIRDYADIGLLYAGIQSAQSALCCVRDGVWSFVDRNDKVFRLYDNIHQDERTIHYATLGEYLNSHYLSTEAQRALMYMYVWLLPKNPTASYDPSDTTEDESIIDFDTNMLEAITQYYDERRMVGQKVTPWFWQDRYGISIDTDATQSGDCKITADGTDYVITIDTSSPDPTLLQIYSSCVEQGLITIPQYTSNGTTTTLSSLDILAKNVSCADVSCGIAFNTPTNLSAYVVSNTTKIEPAKIEFVYPQLKISVKDNYAVASVVTKVIEKLTELLSLGKYGFEQDLVWADLVNELLDEETGVAGLKSVIFIDGLSDGKYYIAEDIKANLGYVFSLKFCTYDWNDAPYADGNITPRLLIYADDGKAYDGRGEVITIS